MRNISFGEPQTYGLCGHGGKELYGPWGEEMMFFHLIRKNALEKKKKKTWEKNYSSRPQKNMSPPVGWKCNEMQQKFSSLTLKG